MPDNLDLKKQLYTLVGLATAVSIITSGISVAIYKIDLVAQDLENHEERLSFIESTIRSRTVMDESQNGRLMRLEQAFFVPRETPRVEL